MAAILVLLLAAVAISLALHAMLRRFVLAVVATALFMGWLLISLRVGPWAQTDTKLMIAAGAMAMAVSAIVGAPLAVARRRRSATRGFDVLPPGRNREIGGSGS